MPTKVAHPTESLQDGCDIWVTRESASFKYLGATLSKKMSPAMQKYAHGLNTAVIARLEKI